MNLWKVEYVGRVGWDQYNGFVIRAASATEATAIAGEAEHEDFR